MNAKLALAIILVLILTAQCSNLKPPPTEDVKLKARLTDEFVEILNEDTAAYILKDAKDLTLPPVVIHAAPVILPIGRSPGRYDSVQVNTIVTKRGNVKRAWILWTPNAYFNKAVLKAIAQWRFQPALRRGVPIDTLIKIAVPLY